MAFDDKQSVMDVTTSQALVLEDDPIIALDISQCLSDFGFGSVHMASTVEDALAHLSENPIRFASLDLKLSGTEPNYGAADRLAALGIPYVIISGLSSSGENGVPLPEPHDRAPRLAKPFNQDGFLTIVRDLLDAQASRVA